MLSHHQQRLLKAHVYSFVQAQIGDRSMRLLVGDADYLLCLVVPSEEAEPTIILSNQAGTMNLSCSCQQPVFLP